MESEEIGSMNYYYRKNYWKYLFLNLHKEYEIKTKNIKIFYTGFNIFGDKILFH